MNKFNYIPFIKSDDSITVSINGEPFTIFSDNQHYDTLYAAIKEKRWDDVAELVSVAKRIEKNSNGLFTVKDGVVYVDGEEVPSKLGTKIIQFDQEGLPFEPLVAFFKNLNENPSRRAVQELFGCLEKNHHPITDDGCFVAYKKVAHNFMDLYSGQFDNSVGKVVSVTRNKVDEDSTKTCSFGLHVASHDYAANQYGVADGNVLLVVKVNPRDVVAVPGDYNEQKMRVCQYEVLSVLESGEIKDNLLRKDGTSKAVGSKEPFEGCYPDCDPKKCAEECSEECDENYCVYCGEEDCDETCSEEDDYDDSQF